MEKPLEDVLGSTRSMRLNGWKQSWKDRVVFIQVEYRLVLDALSKVFQDLPELAVFVIPNQPHLSEFRMLQATDAFWQEDERKLCWFVTIRKNDIQQAVSDWGGVEAYMRHLREESSLPTHVLERSHAVELQDQE